MKSLLFTIAFIIFSSVSHGQISTNCLPDKGIKTARTFMSFVSDDNEINQKDNNYQEVHYDAAGRVILIRNSPDGSEHRREYRNKKLQLMISTRKDLSDFYSAEDLDSLLAHSSEIKDTAMIVRHHPDGEPAELKHADGASQIFEYKGCQEESNILLSPAGDTIQAYRSIFENGVVIQTIWTPFQPAKSEDVVTDFFDYVFNKRGHWISRKYQRSGHLIVEERELTYH